MPQRESLCGILFFPAKMMWLMLFDVISVLLRCFIKA